MKSREYFSKTEIIPLIESHRDWLEEFCEGNCGDVWPSYDPVFLFALMLWLAWKGLDDKQVRFEAMDSIRFPASLDMVPYGPNTIPDTDTIVSFRKKMKRVRRAATLFRQLRNAWIRKFGPGNRNSGCDVTNIESFFKKHFLSPLVVRLVRSCLREAITDDPRLYRKLPAEFIRTYVFEMSDKSCLRISRMKMTLPADMVFSHVGYLILYADENATMRELDSFRELESVFDELCEFLKGRITVWELKITKAVLKRSAEMPAYPSEG